MAVPVGTVAVPVTGRGPRLPRRATSASGRNMAMFLDEFLLTAAGSGCRQVVILGAGLDGRAFRLHWPGGTHVWELDVPEMINFKEDVIARVGR